MTKISINENGYQVVEIDKILFSGKRKINWDGVEKYLKKYVGKQYMIDETDELIYIGTEFPDEYANSRYSARAFGTVGKAKANASQAISALIHIVSDISFQENAADKHKGDAKFGWYRCTVRFTLPITDDKGKIIGKNLFRGRMIIRCDADGKKYLYDIIDIKKET